MGQNRMHTRRVALQWLAAGAAGPAGLPALRAAEFPERQIRIISPTSPGGSVDTIARVMAEKMQKTLGQPVIVEHRPGASGAIGATLVARGAKDGYMIYLGTSSTLGIAKLLSPELPYEPVKDFAPVAMVGSIPVGIFTSPATGINSIEELVAAARAKPGELSYASTGLLSLTHLAGELLAQRADIKMVHIPYTGTGARYWGDLMGGRLQVVFTGVTAGIPLAKDGKVRFLAVASRERSRLLPDIPAVGEIFPGFDVPAWSGFAVAAGTPTPIVQKLEAATLAALQDPATRSQFAAAGVDLDPIMGSRAFAAKIAADNQMWEKTLRTAGLVK